MTARKDAVNEIKNVIGILSKQLDDKKAWENNQQEIDLKNRIAHLHHKTVQLNAPNIKKFDYDFDDLEVEATAPAPVHTKGKPEPIIWLGRGYMGDKNDN